MNTIWIYPNNESEDTKILQDIEAHLKGGLKEDLADGTSA